MPRNGAGSYILPAGNPVVTNTTISSSWANNTLSDIGGAITQSLSKDGQTTPTANLTMGGFKLTNLSAGSSPGDSLRYEQLFSQGNPTDIASAGTVDIGGEYNTFLNVTGNTTITSFGVNYNGPRFLIFKASLTLTHDSTTLICPANSNIITQAGDVAIVIPKSTISGTADGWKVVSYLRANNAILNNDMQTIASASTINFTTAQSQLYSITGTTDVTAVTMYEAQPVFAIAAGAFKLVNGSNLILPGSADYTCSVNDVLMFIKDGSGVVYVLGIQKIFNSTNDPTFSSTSSTGGTSPQWVDGYVNKTALIKQGTAVTTSGAAFYDFVIPAGVKRVTVMLNGVSTNGTSSILFQINSETTGYTSMGQRIAGNATVEAISTVGFLVNTNSASYVLYGTLELNNLNGNNFISNHSIINTTGIGIGFYGAGSKTTSAQLSALRITTVSGTDLFDGGTVNISWEF